MLRKALPDDLDFIYNLYMHPQVNPWLLYEPMGKEDFKGIYEDLLLRGVKYVFSVKGTDTGMVKIVPNTYRSAHVAYIGGLAIDPAFAGQGHGKKMMQEIIAFTSALGFKRLELTVDIINKRAIGLYKQAGFLQEGILKKYTYLATDDKYLDEILMAYLF